MSSFNAFHLGVAKFEVMRLFLLAILYVITFNLLNDCDKISVFYGFIALAVLHVCTYSFYEAFVLHIPRPTGGTGNPNGLAIVANIGFALFLVLFLDVKGTLKRSYYFSGLAITSTAIFISNARSGYLTLIFTLFFQLMRKKTVYAHYILVALALLILLNVLPEFYTHRPGKFVSAIYERGFKAVEREPRYVLLRASIDIFLKHPVLGVGPWSFPKIYMEKYAHKYHGTRLFLVPHSGIWGLLAEFGFFAFVFFAGYVISTAYIFRKSAKLAELLKRPRERIAVLIAEATFWAFFAWGVFQDIAAYRFAYVFPAIGAAMYSRLLKVSKEEDEGAGNPPAVSGG
ncbi:MAG: O-antigen ligase family protein [Candidatus Coatesbacteria bacterium]|nr:MAG: O-antigen ligase family protein [Candidatus Coatesbacteria bacterium]